MRPGSKKSPPKKLTIGLIGCGKMGTALLHGWLASGLVKHVDIVDPAPSIALPASKSIHVHAALDDCKNCASKWEVLVLAVKPQVMDDVCRTLRPLLRKDMLVLSIAAGKTLASFARALGESQAVMRCMPNLPASIGKGISVACANAHVTPDQKNSADLLLRSVGITEWVENENLLDAVTALSGSGPAYVFHLMEVMAEAGKAEGLDAGMAMRLARQTVIGAAALAEAEPNSAADLLRKNVTSPGGTTEAALKILMDGKLRTIFTDALAAATLRSKELSS